MSDPHIDHLEREVEAARSRVTGDLARLRDPNAMSELKRDISYEVKAAKDRVTQSARDAASAKVNGALDGIKARIAANPLAAAAIASGIAWRLGKHPPIASALLGAGLVSLLRTDPQHPTAAAGWVEQASETAVSARRRIEEWDPQETRDAIGETFEFCEGAGFRLERRGSGDRKGRGQPRTRQRATRGRRDPSHEPRHRRPRQDSFRGGCARDRGCRRDRLPAQPQRQRKRRRLIQLRVCSGYSQRSVLRYFRPESQMITATTPPFSFPRSNSNAAATFAPPE